MSIADDWNSDAGLLGIPAVPVPMTNQERPLHRIAEVRREQGVSLRSAARRMGTSIDQVRRQENGTCDMSLSELYHWQRILQVPVINLLVDADGPLSEPVLSRARLLRVMKTVRAIKESAADGPVTRLSQMLEEQLIEMMPELKEVTAWHSVGQRRSQSEVGRIAERTLPDSFFSDGLA